MTVLPYQKHLNEAFLSLLISYFNEIACDIPTEIIQQKLFNFILQQIERNIIHVSFLMDKEYMIGFSLYQIDTRDSDWCKRPGWGFIREFYIRPDYRNAGNGHSLECHTISELSKLGTNQIYLTCGSAIGFWTACGWCVSTEICSNGLTILEK